MINASGESFSLSSWDWDYYTEKVRAERYSFDASQLKPYFEMDNVLQNGVFAASQLFGLSFTERFDRLLIRKTSESLRSLRRTGRL